MANWTGVITNAGNVVLNEWVNEKALTMDRAAAGQGTVSAAGLLAQTALVSQRQEAHLLGGEKDSNGIRLKLRFPAADNAYTLNQIGVWASVTGGESTMIALFQHEQGIPIPSQAESPDFLYTFYGLISCSNTGVWNVTVDTSVAATVGDLEQAKTDSVAEALEQITTSPEAEELTDSDAFATVTATGIKRTPLSLLKQILGKLFAPSGYGLGTESVNAPDDLDSVIGSGWYGGCPVIESFDFGGSPVMHNAYGDRYGVQVARLLSSTTSYGDNVTLLRTKNDGVWGPWEWVNPPMLLGVEYRTTERYNGKAVYAKLLNFGYMPVNTYKIVAHDIQNMDSPLAIFGEARGAFGACTIPSKSMANGYWNNDVDVLFDKANAQIVTRNADTGILTDSVTAILVMKYTKTTD